LGAGTSGAETTEQVPALTGWNPVNALTVSPDATDGRTYLYPDQASKEAGKGGGGAGSVAHIRWDLSDGSGRSPGIQVVNNDEPFQVENCVMASGEPDAKTCSDPAETSRHFRLAVTQANQPVDLVFDVGEAPRVYDEGINTSSMELGRIYRVFQELVNATGERVQSFKVELGYGVGDDFQPASPDDGLAFELRSGIAPQFLGDIGYALSPDHGGDKECRTCHMDGEGPDATPIQPPGHGEDHECSHCHAIAGYRAVWDPQEFALFADNRFGPPDLYGEEFGFFDEARAGLVPPQDGVDKDHTQFIGTGTTPDGTTGVIGATTVNYFDMGAHQAAAASLPGQPFGYLLPESMVATGIFHDDDGDAATPSELVAWWDGKDWRYGVGGDFEPVAEERLSDWAEQTGGDDGSPSYRMAPIDALSTLEMATYIYLGEGFDTEAHDRVTLRLTVKTVAQGTVAGDADPEWTLAGNAAPDLSAYEPAGDEGGDDGAGGCALNSRASFDPTLTLLIALALAGVWGRWRRARSPVV
jgi:hypothetical protein